MVKWSFCVVINVQSEFGLSRTPAKIAGYYYPSEDKMGFLNNTL